MGCLHDPANDQQFTCILNTFAGSLLDRVNILLMTLFNGRCLCLNAKSAIQQTTEPAYYGVYSYYYYYYYETYVTSISTYGSFFLCCRRSINNMTRARLDNNNINFATRTGCMYDGDTQLLLCNYVFIRCASFCVCLPIFVCAGEFEDLCRPC